MDRLRVRIATVVTALGASMPAWAQSQQGGYYGPHMMWGGWYGMFFGPLMMIIFIAAVIALVALAIRWLGGGHHSGQQQPSTSSTKPLEILRERYASGDIDKEEFEERRRVLGE